MGVNRVERGLLRRGAGASLRVLRRSTAGALVRVAPPALAVTFDDGPHPTITPRILDLLGEFGVPGTFFLLGEEATRHPHVVARMLAEGHAIGSHSNTHVDVYAVSARRAMVDIQAGRDAVEQVAQRSVALFRPPHGRLTVNVAARLRWGDWRTWLWSVDSYDWKSQATEEMMVAASNRAGAGDVVLFHDTCAVTEQGLRGFLNSAAAGNRHFTLLD